MGAIQTGILSSVGEPVSELSIEHVLRFAAVWTDSGGLHLPQVIIS